MKPQEKQPEFDPLCVECGQTVSGKPGEGFVLLHNADSDTLRVQHKVGQCPRKVDFPTNRSTLV